MLIECLDVRDSIVIASEIDLSKIDKLFLVIDTIDQMHFYIPQKELPLFAKLDISKIILVKYFALDLESSDDQDLMAYIPFDAWKGDSIGLDHSYQYQNYNFITLPKYSWKSSNYNFDALPNLTQYLSQFRADKINVCLVYFIRSNCNVNDQIRAAGGENFIDILIEAKLFHYRRTLTISLGMSVIGNAARRIDSKGLEIIDDKVYLKF